VIAERLALHESQHAVVAWKLGLEIRDIWIKGLCAETVVVVPPGRRKDLLRVKMAAIAGQRIWGADRGCRADKEQADALLTQWPDLEWDSARELQLVSGILDQEQLRVERLSQALLDLGGCLTGKAVCILLEGETAHS